MAVLQQYRLDRVRSLEEACDVVQSLRQRPLTVVDDNLGAGLSGMWLGYPNHDRIIVNTVHAITELHRAHIVAHELIHIVEALDNPEHERDEGRRDGYDDPTEQRVEAAASRLMISLAAVGGTSDRLTALELYR
ncbi:hypothetical protein [Promicromonospora sp. NPDC023987]|uniref:hypothetical protein n=1 Tax=Promicromonospora sp. NPDC023987 TaxID=3155360 RepID=UPI003411C9F8